MRLGDVCQVVSGATPKTGNESFWGGDIKWITPAEIDENAHVITQTAKSLTPEGFASASLRMLPAGTVLLTTRAPIGKVAIAGVPMCCNQGFKNLVCSDVIYNEYLYRLLKFNSGALQAMGRGATFKELSKRNVESFVIRIPNYEWQRRIVHNLLPIENLIAAAKQQLSLLDDLVKSRFVEMFGDTVENELNLPSERLGSIAFVGSSKRVFKNELVADGIPFLRGTEVGAYGAGQKPSPTLFITRMHYDHLVAQTGSPEIGDLLMPSICPDGQIWEVNTDSPFYFKDGRVLWIRPNRKILNSTYLRFALKNRFQTSFDGLASGTTFAELKIVVLKKMTVLLPPLPLQQEFADFVAKVDKSRFFAGRWVAGYRCRIDT